MAVWIPAAISAGASILGHIMNRRGGRPKAQQVNTDLYSDEIAGIRQRTGEMNDMFMRNASAGAGFAQQTQQRMAGAMGVPQAQNTLMSMAMAGQEQAQMASMQNSMQGQGQVNQMIGMQGNAEQFNAQQQTMQNFNNENMRRQDISSLIQGISGSAMAGFGAMQDENRYQDSVKMQNKQFGLLQRMLAQQGGNSSKK